jgi:uncharacterized protein
VFEAIKTLANGDSLACSSRRLNWRRRATPLLLFGLVASTLPVRAQVRLIPDAAGADYNIQVMSWWDIPFRTIVRQHYDFSCGSAAVATLLTHHYGVATTEQQPFAAMWNAGDRAKIKKAGFSMFDMKSFLDARGFQTEGYRMGIDDLRKSGRPTIVLLNLNGFKHFVVVKGVRGNIVLVGDPIRGLNKYDVGEFKKAWNGIALAIAKVPDGTRVGYNLARDWNPWSTAPIDEAAQDRTIGDVTDHLPPIYQLTPQILLDVRVGTVK